MCSRLTQPVFPLSNVPATPSINMAIFSAVPPPPELGGVDANAHDNEQQQSSYEGAHTTGAPSVHPSLPSNVNGLDIESWTISALESLSISPLARGTGAPLSIPLDEAKEKAKRKEKLSVSICDPHARSGAITPPPRPPSRRDSLKRREALLKGNEGSRQRRRWENGTSFPCFSRRPHLSLFSVMRACA